MQTPEGTAGARTGEVGSSSTDHVAPFDLRAARRLRGHSIREMAVLVGVTWKVLYGAERGARPRRPRDQVAIADFFGFDLLEQWPDDPPNQQEAA